MLTNPCAVCMAGMYADALLRIVIIGIFILVDVT